MTDCSRLMEKFSSIKVCCQQEGAINPALDRTAVMLILYNHLPQVHYAESVMKTTAT